VGILFYEESSIQLAADRKYFVFDGKATEGDDAIIQAPVLSLLN